MTLPDTNPRIKEAMDTLLKMFDEENLEKVARAVFRGEGSIPADKWSFLNRVLMYLNDTMADCTHCPLIFSGKCSDCPDNQAEVAEYFGNIESASEAYFHLVIRLNILNLFLWSRAP